MDEANFLEEIRNWERPTWYGNTQFVEKVTEIFLEPEKKWYSISADSPQGEWDRVAELTMIKFGESGHPVFRATSSLSRGTLQSKGGKIINTPLRWWRNDWNCFFAQLFLSISSVFAEQSQKCLKNTKLFTIVRGNPLWEDNRVPHSCQDWSRQRCLWIVITVLTKIFCCNNIENELKSYHNETDWANFLWLENSFMLLRSDRISWRKTPQNSHNSQIQWPCREYTLPREEEASEPEGWIRGNTKTGPVLEVATCCLHCK